MAKLYVLGGRERRPGLKEPSQNEVWELYEAALIFEIDTDTPRVHTCVEYTSPREARAGDKPSAQFHSGAVIDRTLYACTRTEILIFQLPEFTRIGYISLPCFNDLHHVTRSSDGNLLAVSTGLDMVIKLTPRGEVLNQWNVIGEDPWMRFSRTIDYRQVETTKPHASHPNHVFELDGEVWVTRFHQQDAISLNGSGGRIEIGDERAHDGLVRGQRIYFTGVDGKIVIVNRRTLKVDEIIDLRTIQDSNREVLPAWCRGIYPEDEQRIWVGFTRIRKTQFQENLRWVKTILHKGTLAKRTHIALFDIINKRCLQEIELEPYGMNAVYGIFPVPT